MKETSKITRREFLELTVAASGAIALNSLGCTASKGRENYKIFSSGQIGNLNLKNRLIRSATFESAAVNGEVTDTYLNLLRDLAAGGAGMIITGVLGVFEENAFERTIQIYDDRFIDSLAEVLEEVRFADSQCKLVGQLYHTGDFDGPSINNWPYKANRNALSTDKIAEIVSGFAEAVERVQKAGWDGVEIHAAHQYLLSSFLSPITNKREDHYGGSVENRVRIISEIMSEARNRVGSDFMIIIKLNGSDYFDGGIDIDSFPEIALEIEKTGVDAIDISGVNCLVPYVTPPQQSYFLKYAEALDIELPIILTGGNRSVELLEDIAQENKIDFFAMARPLVREPDLPNRWLSGEGDATPDCISCNQCFKVIASESLHCVWV